MGGREVVGGSGGGGVGGGADCRFWDKWRIRVVKLMETKPLLIVKTINLFQNFDHYEEILPTGVEG